MWGLSKGMKIAAFDERVVVEAGSGAKYIGVWQGI